MSAHKILIVEDEVIVARDLKKRLEDRGYEVVGMAVSGAAALKIAEESQPNLAMMDIQIKGDKDGVETARELRLRFDIPVIFLTANSDEGTLSRAKEVSPLGFLIKPFNERELHTTIETALYRDALERRVRNREHLLSVILSSISEGVIATDENGLVQSINSMGEKLTGVSAADALNKRFREVFRVVDEDSGEAYRCPLQNIIKEGCTETTPDGLAVVDTGGERTAVECTGSPLLDPGSKVSGAAFVFKDVSERRDLERKLAAYQTKLEEMVQKRTEQLMAESSERAKAEDLLHLTQISIDKSADVALWVRPDGTIKYANDVATVNLEYTHEELLECLFEDIFKELTIKGSKPWGSWGEFWHSLRKGGTVTVEAEQIASSGNKVQVEIQINHIKFKGLEYAFVYSRDISERKRADEEASKREKLESLGMLAGGIAHDFNNLLTGILGNISLMKMPDEAEEDLEEYIKEAEDATLRARQLSRQLLTFSKGGAPVKEVCSLKDLLDMVSKFILRGSNSDRLLEIDENLHNVDADQGHISQVIQNLVANASQSMSAGGTVSIHARNRTLATDNSCSLPAGGYVEVAVKDQGSGINEENLSKIFDPYFTTKDDGHGLGLATTFSIIKQHGGAIVAESEVGVGSEFKFYLPATLEKTKVSTGISSEVVRGKKSRILVMDDEKFICTLVERMLGTLGHEVESSADGLTALRMYSEALAGGEKFDAVILDMTIPGGMGGIETAQKIREVDPTAKIIISSGYSGSELDTSLPQGDAFYVLPKPYTLLDMSEIVSSAVGTVA